MLAKVSTIRNLFPHFKPNMWNKGSLQIETDIKQVTGNVEEYKKTSWQPDGDKLQVTESAADWQMTLNTNSDIMVHFIRYFKFYSDCFNSQMLQFKTLLCCRYGKTETNLIQTDGTSEAEGFVKCLTKHSSLTSLTNQLLSHIVWFKWRIHLVA